MGYHIVATLKEPRTLNAERKTKIRDRKWIQKTKKIKKSKRKNYLLDMDGVLIRGKELIPGADKFVTELIGGVLE